MTRLARAFVARIHKVLLQIKSQTKIYTSCPAEYVTMCVYMRLLRICDMYHSLVRWSVLCLSVNYVHAQQNIIGPDAMDHILL